MATPKRRATYDDVVQAPEDLVAELIDGELFTSPRPALAHARAAFLIAQDLAPWDGRPGAPGRRGGWWFLFEPELHLAEDVLVPDVAAWRMERLPSIPNAAALTLPPDWLCEVVSPSTGRLDRTKKLAVYGRAGVSHAWLVDPLARTLEIYRLEAGRWVLIGAFGGDEIVAAVEPFDGLRIELSRWWIDSADVTGTSHRPPGR